MIFWAQPPLVPGEEEARRWAEEELSRAIYQGEPESLFQRLLNAIFELFDRTTASPDVSTQTAAFVVVGFLVVLLIVAFSVYGPLRRSRKIRRPSHEVLVDDTRTAAELRAASLAHENAGQWSQAVMERFRAITRSLIERVILDDLPGQTALEVARASQPHFPSSSADIVEAALLFDRVCYGEIPATAAEAVWMRNLDERVEVMKPSASPRAMSL